MSVAEALLVVVSVGVATYVMRAGLILLLANRTLPPIVERSLRYVGPAVLAALTVSLAFGNSDGGTPNIEAPEVIALLVSGAVAVWRRNLVQTLVVGMTTFWICSALI